MASALTRMERFKQRMARKKQRSPSPPGTALLGSKFMHTASKFLGPYLPSGWANYFKPVKTGKYYGLRIACPICSATPGDLEYGSRRWRWLSVHLATEHKSWVQKDRP